MNARPCRTTTAAPAVIASGLLSAHPYGRGVDTGDGKSSSIRFVCSGKILALDGQRRLTLKAHLPKLTEGDDHRFWNGVNHSVLQPQTKCQSAEAR